MVVFPQEVQVRCGLIIMERCQYCSSDVFSTAIHYSICPAIVIEEPSPNEIQVITSLENALKKIVEDAHRPSPKLKKQRK